MNRCLESTTKYAGARETFTSSPRSGQLLTDAGLKQFERAVSGDDLPACPHAWRTKAHNQRFSYPSRGATRDLECKDAGPEINRKDLSLMPTRMIGIGRHASLIILAASSAIFAQSVASSVQAQDRPGVPDVRQIVESSIAATQRHWRERLHYT
jgi:hypothetical protein